MVTSSDPDRRIVHEFNARVAAQEFALAVGIMPDALTPFSFASHPVVVRVGGEYYCRSIQKLNPDGSLSFFCAIDNSIVASIAQPTGMVKSTRIGAAGCRRQGRRHRCPARLRLCSASCRCQEPTGVARNFRSVPHEQCHRFWHLWRTVPHNAPQPDADRHRLRPPASRRMDARMPIHRLMTSKG